MSDPFDRSSPPGAPAPSRREARAARGPLRRYLAAAGGPLGLIWLVYLLNIPLVLLFMGAEAWRWWLSAGVVAVFLAIYLPMLTARSERATIAFTAALVLLASLAVPLTPGANVIWIYAAGGVGYLSTVRRGAIGVALVEVAVLLHGALAWWLAGPSLGLLASIYLPPLFFVLIIGAVNVVGAAKHRSDAKLRRAYDEVERLAAVAERERIARDLHDLLGHTLSVIRVKAELAARLAPADAERAAAEMRDVEATAREALAEVRAAVSGYRARGLDSELASAKLALESAGVAFRYDGEVEGGGDALPPALEHTLAFALREAVTNVVRHSGASRCRVALRRRSGGADDGRPGVELAVRDNGRGRVAGAPAEDDRNGLRGMSERLRAVGGRLEIDDEDGFGLRAWVPLPRTGARAATTGDAPAASPRSLGGSA